MKNRVTVTIAGQEYTLVGTEEASYTEKVAAHVDAKVEEVLSGAHVSLVDGAILAAVNIADEYFKEVEAALCFSVAPQGAGKTAEMQV